MIGTIISPIPRPAARAMNGLPTAPPRKSPGQSGWMISGRMKLTAKKPIATVGMPARISRVGLTILRTRGRAYSLR